jgi:hypothetical protein
MQDHLKQIADPIEILYHHLVKYATENQYPLDIVIYRTTSNTNQQQFGQWTSSNEICIDIDKHLYPHMIGGTLDICENNIMYISNYELKFELTFIEWADTDMLCKIKNLMRRMVSTR